MIKKIISLLIASGFVLTGAYAATHKTISVYVDNEKITFDSEPYLQSGYTMVPMRAIMEALDADVSWEEETLTATAIQNFNVTKFTIGSHDYYKNGALQYMPVAAVQKNNRTYVPLRAISEGFGFEVSWEDSTSTVYINSNKKSVPEENIYYIKSKNDNYLTVSENGIEVSSEPTGNAMWALECADSENGIFYIYSMKDLYNPLGYCTHTVKEEEPEEKPAKKSTGKKGAEESETPAPTEPVKERLNLCTGESHRWVIEPTDNGYILTPEGTDVNLDAEKADVGSDAELMLIPCI